jgi:hypothetical protein
MITEICQVRGKLDRETQFKNCVKYRVVLYQPSLSLILDSDTFHPYVLEDNSLTYVKLTSFRKGKILGKQDYV